MFNIEIDPSINNIIFANIAEYSQYPQEQEILFDLGCTFKIISVHKDDSDPRLVVKMISVNEGEKLANDFIKTIKIRKETSRDFDGLINDFVHKIGYERGMRLYEHFLKLSIKDIQRIIKNCSRFINLYEKCSEVSNAVILYGCFGWFFTQKGEYDLAIRYCTQALSLLEENASVYNIAIEIAMIHNTIGWSYYEKGKYDDALFWCQKAAERYKNCSRTEDSKYVHVLRFEQNLKKSASRNDVEFAEILTNIGCIYYKKNDFNTAMAYCKRSMNILERCDHTTIFDGNERTTVASRYEIDNHHETVAANWEIFANIYYSKENYSLALQYYQRAKDIFETITPRIPMCLQRSPAIFGRNIQRLQHFIQITQQKLLTNDEMVN